MLRKLKRKYRANSVSNGSAARDRLNTFDSEYDGSQASTGLGLGLGLRSRHDSGTYGATSTVITDSAAAEEAKRVLLRLSEQEDAMKRRMRERKGAPPPHLGAAG